MSAQRDLSEAKAPGLRRRVQDWLFLAWVGGMVLVPAVLEVGVVAGWRVAERVTEWVGLAIGGALLLVIVIAIICFLWQCAKLPKAERPDLAGWLSLACVGGIFLGVPVLGLCAMVGWRAGAIVGGGALVLGSVGWCILSELGEPPERRWSTTIALAFFVPIPAFVAVNYDSPTIFGTIAQTIVVGIFAACVLALVVRLFQP